ncbi:MAG: DUF4862 family protein [Proteobacteria bacterium]|nr:DUF4862 family protein [Pseudomonadota bacterium]
MKEFSRGDAELFYQELRILPGLLGLELPVHRESKHDDPWQHLDLLPEHWDYVLTPLPAVMQSLKQSASFGLASLDQGGREAALHLMDEVRQKLTRLNEHCGRKAVRAVLVHSAPSLAHEASSASADALRDSFEKMARWDWCGAELWLEHCDSPKDQQNAAKGFLPLPMELALLQEFSWGLSLNWGRSVLEGRSPRTIKQHILAAKAAAVLRGFFFSGVAEGDPLYGTWQDNHAPLALDCPAPWQAKKSLLTADEVLESLELIQPLSVLLGIKVQPAPLSLSLQDRLSFIKVQLKFLQTLISNRCGNTLESS